jgi:hypothetical protein
MPSRFWEMAAGCLIFIGFQKRSFIEQLLEKVPPLLVIALIVAVMYLPISISPASNIAMVALSSVLIACLKKQTAALKVFTNPKVVYIGLISYSLYLWHWSVLSISRWTIGIHWWSIPVQISLILLLSSLSYKYIERPNRLICLPEFKSQYAIIIASLPFTALALVLLGGIFKKTIYLGKTESDLLLESGRFAIHEKLNICDREDLDDAYLLQMCLPQSNDDKTIIFLGDSHSRSIWSAAEVIAKEVKMTPRAFVRYGSIFPPIQRFQSDGELVRRRRLYQTFSKVQARLLRLDNPGGGIIIIDIRIPFYFGAPWYENTQAKHYFNLDSGDIDSDRRMGFKLWLGRLDEFAQHMAHSNYKVIVFLPYPEFPEAVTKRCDGQNIQWFNRLKGYRCQFDANFFIDDATGKYSNLYRELKKVSDKNNNLFLFETMNLFCPNKLCSFSDARGRPLYRDDDHYNDIAAKEVVAPALTKFLKSLD